MGLDLARPMMDKLIAKTGGTLVFPLVQADATRMPFPDDVFGAAYLRWVLHLIPAWETAVAEMVRVVRPEGVICALLGAYGGLRGEIQDRFSEITGIDHAPVGLGWNATAELDRAMAALGPAVPSSRSHPAHRGGDRGGLHAQHRGEPLLVDLAALR